MTGRRRRIAVHKAITDAGELGLCAIELVGDEVVGCYEIDGELAYTEWLGGTAVIKTDAHGVLRAYYNGKPIE